MYSWLQLRDTFVKYDSVKTHYKMNLSEYFLLGGYYIESETLAIPSNLWVCKILCVYPGSTEKIKIRGKHLTTTNMMIDITSIRGKHLTIKYMMIDITSIRGKHLTTKIMMIDITSIRG